MSYALVHSHHPWRSTLIKRHSILLAIAEHKVRQTQMLRRNKNHTQFQGDNYWFIIISLMARIRFQSVLAQNTQTYSNSFCKQFKLPTTLIMILQIKLDAPLIILLVKSHLGLPGQSVLTKSCELRYVLSEFQGIFFLLALAHVKYELLNDVAVTLRYLNNIVGSCQYFRTHMPLPWCSYP